jgi:hypothetical protein
MTTTINFYEGSYLFESITTEFNVTTDFIEMKLAKQYEYRPTNEDLWAVTCIDSVEFSRYEFINGDGLKQVEFN